MSEALDPLAQLDEKDREEGKTPGSGAASNYEESVGFFTPGEIVVVRLETFKRGTVTKSQTRKGDKYAVANLRQIKVISKGEQEEPLPDGTLRSAFFNLPPTWPTFDPEMVKFQHKKGMNNCRALVAEILNGVAHAADAYDADDRASLEDVMTSHIEKMGEEDGKPFADKGVFLMAKTKAQKNRDGERKCNDEGKPYCNVYFDVVDPETFEKI